MPYVSGLGLSDLMPTPEPLLLLQLTDKEKEGPRAYIAFPTLFNPFLRNLECQAQCLGSEVLGSFTTFPMRSHFYRFVSVITFMLSPL